MDQDEDLQRCIEHCLECYRVCNETANGYCLEKGGEHTRPAHMRLMIDCSEICRVGADFMMRQSQRHPEVCALCADICDECAEECSRYADEDMRLCAETCRNCAASCRDMAEAQAP
jgi:hypothetical protein